MSLSQDSGASGERVRQKRAPRLTYSEEQKFFIMYSRIGLDQSWSEIEDRFADAFNRRSKGGLTSAYYRIRRTWGLEEVLKGGPQSFADDQKAVENRARNFSAEYLISVGYPVETGGKRFHDEGGWFGL